MHALSISSPPNHAPQVQRASRATKRFGAVHQWIHLPTRPLRKARLCYLAASRNNHTHKSRVSVFELSVTRANVEMQGKGGHQRPLSHRSQVTRVCCSDVPSALSPWVVMAARRSSFGVGRAGVDSHHTNLLEQQSCGIPSLPMPTQSSAFLTQPKPDLGSPAVCQPGSAVERLRASLLVDLDGALSSGFMAPAALRIPWRRQAP